jgi:hypothetical protein
METISLQRVSEYAKNGFGTKASTIEHHILQAFCRTHVGWLAKSYMFLKLRNKKHFKERLFNWIQFYS